MDTAVLAVRTILSLAVVLGLIWYAGRRLNDSTSGRGGDGVFAAWVRKAGGVVGRAPARGRRRAERPSPVVAVVGRQAIGPKASVAVVDVGGQRLVLGVSEAGVALLATMDVPEAVMSAVDEALPAAATAAGLAAAPALMPVPVVLLAEEDDAEQADTEHADTAGAPDGTDPVAATPAALVHPAPATVPIPVPVVPAFDEIFAAATVAQQPSGMSGSILSPSTWRQARAALRPGPIT